MVDKRYSQRGLLKRWREVKRYIDSGRFDLAERAYQQFGQYLYDYAALLDEIKTRRVKRGNPLG